MRKIQLAEGNYYHVYNRGVDKRCIFKDEHDYARFYASLYLFNDANYSNSGHDVLHNDVLLAAHDVLQHDRDPFVRIVSFCLMPNHFHLLLYQKKENGIAKFMQKLGTGYTGYFNRKNDRSGSLFEATYKTIHVAHDGQFQHMPRYIHCNALDLSTISWRDGGVVDWSIAQKALDVFPWSSHSVYMEVDQELPVVDEWEVRNMFPDRLSYSSFLEEWATRGFVDGRRVV